jgi:hypothetical protein
MQLLIELLSPFGFAVYLVSARGFVLTKVQDQLRTLKAGGIQIITIRQLAGT